jgi:hypothetical protein
MVSHKSSSLGLTWTSIIVFESSPEDSRGGDYISKEYLDGNEEDGLYDNELFSSRSHIS